VMKSFNPFNSSFLHFFNHSNATQMNLFDHNDGPAKIQPQSGEMLVARGGAKRNPGLENERSSTSVKEC